MNLLPVALGNFVRADEQSNTLAISAPKHVLSGILADIAAIDSPRKHIMLDARVVVLERADLLDFGAEWKLPQITAGGVMGHAMGFPWEMQIGYSSKREFTTALSLTLNLLTQNEEATIIASPQVLAQDGKEAEIKVTTEEYFQIASEVGNFLRSDLEKIETGTILRITPQVGPKGELTLDMNIEVSDVVARGNQNLSGHQPAHRAQHGAARKRRHRGGGRPGRHALAIRARRGSGRGQPAAARPGLPHRHAQPPGPPGARCSSPPPASMPTAPVSRSRRASPRRRRSSTPTSTARSWKQRSISSERFSK